MSGQETVLIADDDKSIRTVLAEALARYGYRTRTTGNASTLWHWLSDGHGDVVVGDVLLPDESLLKLLPRMRRLRPELNFILMSAQSPHTAIAEAQEKGAFDFLPKPFDLEKLAVTVDAALKAPPAAPKTRPTRPAALAGTSAAIDAVRGAVARLCRLDLPCLIDGAVGSGRLTAAKTMHEQGNRAGGPFIVIECESVDAALFLDQIARADGGTLILQSIETLSSSAQESLSRAIQDSQTTDVRYIATATPDLGDRARQGLFRQDLRHRLSASVMSMPPLAERSGDLQAIVEALAADAEKDGLPAISLDQGALDELSARLPWDQLRGLDRLVRRLATLSERPAVDASVMRRALAAESGTQEQAPAANGHGDLRRSEEQAPQGLADIVERHLTDYFAAHGEDLPPPQLYSRIIQEVERPLMTLTLEATRGNQLRAAEVLGLNRNTLRKKIRDLDIQVSRRRKGG